MCVQAGSHVLDAHDKLLGFAEDTVLKGAVEVVGWHSVHILSPAKNEADAAPGNCWGSDQQLEGWTCKR